MFSKIISRLLLLGLGLLPPSGFAKDSPVTWSIALSHPNPAVGDELDLVITARITSPWIVYASDFKADLGPQPTQFRFMPQAASFDVFGSPRSIAPHRGRDKTWESDYTYFSDRAEFRQRIKLRSAAPAGRVQIKGQLCHQRNGTCTLFDETLSL